MPWVCQDCGHEYPSSRSRCTECKLWDVEHVRQVKETVAVGGEIPDISEHEPEVERSPDVQTDGSVGEQPEETQWSDVGDPDETTPSLSSRLWISSEIYGTKTKGHLRTVVSLLGIGLVCLGAFNLLAAPVLETATFAPYRITGVALTPDGQVVRNNLEALMVEEGPIFFLDDVLAIAVGSILAWLS